MSDLLRQLAKMIDHSLLHPTLTDKEVKEGCELAMKYDVATVCVKPYHVRQCVQWLEGSDMLVCSVIGFPHGNSSTSIKVAETRRACRQGAKEIDMVINVGKALGDNWTFVIKDIRAVQDECLLHGAILKVIFENDYLTHDLQKIRLCEICSQIGVAFVKTSTGYGFVKGADDRYGYKGATDYDLRLMRRHCPPSVQIKAAGGIRTLDDLLRVRALGVTRIGATATAAMLEEAKERFGVGEEVEGLVEEVAGH